MKLFINLILDGALFFLSFIVPKKKNTYLLGAGDGLSFKGNPKYLYLHILQKRNDLLPVWITESNAVYNELLGKKVPVVHKYSINGFFAILRSRYLVIEIMTKDIMYTRFSGLGRFVYIQTFHGMPLKKIANDANQDLKGIGRVQFFGIEVIEIVISKFKAWLKVIFLYRRYDIITASCPECKEIFQNAFLNNNVEVLGFARNDVLYREELREKNFKNKLSATGYIKIISYVPTFRDIDTGKKPFSPLGLQKLNTYLERNKFLLLVKKHPYDTTLTISGEFANICDVSLEADDIMQLLAVTDILITDYSSVFFDFILTGKPVIYYSYDYLEYLDTCRNMYFDFSDILPGPFAETEDELLNLIVGIDKWFKEKKYVEKYLALNDRFNSFRDGNSCERLLNYIQKEIT